MAYSSRDGTSNGLRAWVGLVSFLQFGTALAVILITYFKLSHISSFNVNGQNRSYSSTGTCLLGPDTNTTTLCVYAYFIAGISILATIIVALFLCCTCDLCGCGSVFEFIFAAAGTAWWAIAAIVLMKKSWAADDANVGNHDWRLANWIICWVGCGLFLLLAILSFARAINQLCACCNGGRNNRAGYA
ncbi:g7291 [Coccomyxa viridis]|uniref:G7291 protein n=1 Tax=Coccomyxa viridis TaxID=1274662 RepID=A0ABP1G023_9CHLO